MRAARLVRIALVPLALLHGGCAQQELVRFKAQLQRTHCNQWQPPPGGATGALAPLANEQVPAAVGARFSANSLHMAHAIGVLPLLGDYLDRLAVPQAERTLQQRVELLELRRTLAYRCDLASLAISAVASELDCEEEKISQLADRLKGLEGEVESQLTVAAIAVGAVGALLTGIHLADDDGSSNVDGAGIFFGIAEAGLGAAILLHGKRTELAHPRNALRAVHEGRDADGIFPPSVWYCLTHAVPGEAADHSLRHELLERWHESDPRRERKARAEAALLYGSGGMYNTGQLDKRAAMYDQLESSIKLVKQDLLQLVQELDAQER